MNLLNIKDLNKNFKQENENKLEVLKGINLKIKEKEFISFIGPSGCGKSTLLNILAGLIPASSGQVMLKNKLIQNPGNDRVMVFQEAALFPWLTVIENVLFGLKIKKIDKKKAYQKALDQLEAVQLKNFKDSYPHQLSGGMKQRVAIARALVIDPEILLMDEPFGALDEQTRLMLHRQLIKLWQDTEKTIVFVTHNIREAVKLSDRIIVFGSNPGRIVEEFKIDIPQPRDRENPTLIRLENKILKLLEKEIKKQGEKTYEKIAT
ncbi:ABC transporter ATP-binding protein [Halanaerobium saccharolyticum]|jgi:NitT/TauT family transport system ATP-binding protein|uniref:NitT/TauT family transport system ATP-binding protein n=1 Tax=Halanaerobium saccharolyticum TaxID=43595 RepID=A0A4V3CZK6_9FIRM|nr:ABC transporter ATP-binding protein [Halanaerobium saccharolyticum]TDQ00061.1 NitT/TauT family transport system ATP-binding protein [Halanaerobium saccharolyticum]